MQKFGGVPGGARLSAVGWHHQERLQLFQMLHEVETGQIDRWHHQHTWLGRIIVDGWPWKHPLTELVLKAESAYLKIEGVDSNTKH